MDKWLDNPWVLRGIALLLALLLFSTVPKSDTPGDVNVPSDENVDTIADVPVKSYYDTENLVVSGVPDTVNLTIQGPKNIVKQAKALRDFEVFVDLTELEMGEHQVQINIREISERLTVTIEPSNITVNIQERVTKEYNVAAEFNTDMVADGYVVGTPSIEPSKVMITGAKDTIDQISYVRASVNIDDVIHEPIKREANVLVLDKEMNKLNVIVEPEAVEVSIPVEVSSKKVPIDIVPKGTPPNGVTIESITADIKEATIIANPQALEKVDKVRVEVDISNMIENTEVTLPIIISKEIVSVSPETAKLTIKVKRQEEVTISNIPIDVIGQQEGLDIQFINPANGQTSITAAGQKEVVTALNPDDFSLSIDVSNLLEGEHAVDIQVTSPDSVGWKLENKQVAISIVEKPISNENT